MGGRYFLTGVQLGMLMGTTDEEIRMSILQQVMDEQFIGDFKDDNFESHLKKTCACGKCVGKND